MFCTVSVCLFFHSLQLSPSPNSDYCVPVTLYQEFTVRLLQPSSIRVYSYYQSGKILSMYGLSLVRPTIDLGVQHNCFKKCSQFLFEVLVSNHLCIFIFPFKKKIKTLSGLCARPTSQKPGMCGYFPPH
jgi:hypothetical protein